MKSILFLSATYLSLAFFTSCGTNEVKHTESTVSNLDFQIIKSGVLHGAGEEGIDHGAVLVRNIQEYNDLKNKMNTVNEELEGDMFQNFDFFDEEMLIFVFDKVRGTGGYTFEVEEITDNSESIEIKVLSKRPLDPATSIMTQPYQIVSTLKSDKELTLEIIE